MAPVFANGVFIAPVVLVHHAGRTIGATEPELLRPHVGAALRVGIRLDGSASVPVTHWGLSRHGVLALVELSVPVPRGLDVRPLEVGGVGATLDPGGAPAALIGLEPIGDGFARTWVPVDLDREVGPGGEVAYLASPVDDAHIGKIVDGSTLFAWYPPSPALGRPSEVAALAVARAYRGFAKPRAHPVVAELVGLEDLGRALIKPAAAEARPADDDDDDDALSQIVGELEAAAPGDRQR